MPLLGRFTASISQFANKRGIYLGRRSTKIHVALYRRTNGRMGGHLPGWPEVRIALVDHTGAKSGAKRTSPVICHPDGDSIVVVASKAGQPTHPAWFHNLKANPDVTIEVGDEIIEAHATEVTGAERDELYAKQAALMPNFAEYEKLATTRKIPVLRLTRR